MMRVGSKLRCSSRNGIQKTASSKGGAKFGRLDGKVAIITGAGAGMRREEAILFAREGAKIVVVAPYSPRRKWQYSVIRFVPPNHI